MVKIEGLQNIGGLATNNITCITLPSPIKNCIHYLKIRHADPKWLVILKRSKGMLLLLIDSLHKFTEFKHILRTNIKCFTLNINCILILEF